MDDKTPEETQEEYGKARLFADHPFLKIFLTVAAIAGLSIGVWKWTEKAVSRAVIAAVDPADIAQQIAGNPGVIDKIAKTIADDEDTRELLQVPPGEKGAAGPQGPTGSQGEQGPRGPRGYTGSEGSPGPEGDPGLLGPQGGRGIEGPKGECADRNRTCHEICEDRGLVCARASYITLFYNKKKFPVESETETVRVSCDAPLRQDKKADCVCKEPSSDSVGG